MALLWRPRPDASCRDELILALDLYLRHGERLPDSDEAEMIELYETLNSLFGEQQKTRLSETATAFMKLANFRAADPLYTCQGKCGRQRIRGAFLRRISKAQLAQHAAQDSAR